MSELLDYTEERRDKVEKQLSAEHNKRELMERHSNGIRVMAYWFMKENVCTIYVYDERVRGAVEFVVPNSEVLSHFEHPFAHPDAIFPRSGSEDDGA